MRSTRGRDGPFPVQGSPAWAFPRKGSVVLREAARSAGAMPPGVSQALRGAMEPRPRCVAALLRGQFRDAQRFARSMDPRAIEGHHEGDVLRLPSAPGLLRRDPTVPVTGAYGRCSRHAAGDRQGLARTSSPPRVVGLSNEIVVTSRLSLHLDGTEEHCPQQRAVCRRSHDGLR